jgi:hypothetical protein
MTSGIATPKVMAVQGHHRPLHLEILKYLREENVFGAAT